MKEKICGFCFLVLVVMVVGWFSVTMFRTRCDQSVISTLEGVVTEKEEKGTNFIVISLDNGEKLKLEDSNSKTCLQYIPFGCGDRVTLSKMEYRDDYFIDVFFCKKPPRKKSCFDLVVRGSHGEFCHMVISQ